MYNQSFTFGYEYTSTFRLCEINWLILDVEHMLKAINDMINKDKIA